MNGVGVAIIRVIVLVTTVTLVLAKPAPKEVVGGPTEHKGEECMNQRVKEFFLTYEKANSSSDVSAIGSLYADSFMFGGPNGVQAVKKEDFLKIVPKMKAHFSSMGVSETKLETVDASPLDSKYLLAKVVWTINFRDSQGGKHVEASASYVLARGQEDTLAIVFQIDHQELASTIKRQQSTEH